MKNQILQSIITIGLIAVTGCSAFRSSTQIMTVTTNPQNAMLTINGIKYHPPAQVPVRRDLPVYIQCESEGFEPQQRIIENHLNGTGFLDVVGFVLVLFPGIGLCAPGAHSLDETTVNMDLYHPYVAPKPAPVASDQQRGGHR
jgi:hypothetical protein